MHNFYVSTKGMCMKICGLCLLMILIMSWSTASARLYSSTTFQKLDQDALSKVFGQAGLLSAATDAHPLYEHQIVSTLKNAVDRQQAGIDQLKSFFYIDASGQMRLQVSRDVVSIGVLEFRMNFESFQELGHSIAEQLIFSP